MERQIEEQCVSDWTKEPKRGPWNNVARCHRLLSDVSEETDYDGHVNEKVSGWRICGR